MERFLEALDAYARGEISQEELAAAARSVLAQQPGAAPDLLGLLQARHGIGQVPDVVLAALRETMSGHMASDRGVTDDRTRMRSSPADPSAEDRTRLAGRPPEGDATVVAARRDSDGAAPAGTSGSVSRPATAPPPDDAATTASTAATGSTWGDPAQWAEGPSEAPRPGMTIKQRFVLESVVGRGGMGVVFKARDLRKEEAQDRNPYVAIKVLNEEFKRHPDALKALQRESRKAQNLAHPNIVNVFDFDRDGATVYMTMEYLDGEPLDRVIKRQWPRGMPAQEALGIIEGMGQALAYAHRKGVVHSDFKPGNVFLTTDGTVKVFDFGIAQAAKHTGVDPGEQTLFDAGTLGALTPSYASVEMLEGADPDPRDDIYALACVAYQLYTGRHPFDKLPATDARAKKLVPAPVPGLKRRQWRALLQGLAFERAARSPDVETFLAGFRVTKRSRAALIGGAATVLVAGALIAVLLPGYLQQRRVAQVVAQIEHGNTAQIAAALQEARDFSVQVRASVMQQARRPILAYYRAQVDRHFDPAKGNYDYPGAARLLAQARTAYPDSAGVQDLSDRALSARNKLLNTLNGRLNAALHAGHLLPRPDKDDVFDILNTVAQVKPKDAMLADPRLTIAYVQRAERAAGTKDYGRALKLVDAGLKRFPDNTRLSGLQGKFRDELRFLRVQGKVKALEARIRPVLARARSPADIARLRSSVLALGALYPDDPLLARVQSDVQRVVGRDVDEAITRKRWRHARTLLADDAPLLSLDFTRAKMRRLYAGAGAGAAHAWAQQAQSRVTQGKAQVAALLANPDFSASWQAGIQREMRTLAVLLPPGDSWFLQTRRRIAQFYLQRAQRLGTAQRFAEAGTLLERGQRFALLPAFKQARANLAQAKAKMQAQVQEEQRQARIAAQKQTVLTQVAANDVAGAQRTLAALRRELPAGDPFLRHTVPAAFGAAYLRLARQEAGQHHYVKALTMVKDGLKEAPSLAGLKSALKDYGPQAELEAIETTLRSGGPKALTGLGPRLRKYGAAQPKAYRALAPRLAGIAARRILNVAQSNATLAGALLASARDLFPGNQELNAIRLATPSSAASASARTVSMAPAGRSCSADLAGYGRSPRGTCFDELGGGKRGPLLVVIPPGDGIAAPYAITKYEISVGNYDVYCKLSRRCKVITGRSVNLPLTNVSYATAKAYAAWLSAHTGYRYAIPSNRQWTHAAEATGGGSPGNYNCQVRIGGKLIKGFGLVDVQIGQPNSWGLVNYVGNAQEWVRDRKGLEVRGGSYLDRLSQCGIGLTEPSNGSPNPATGFRLVRSLRTGSSKGNHAPRS